MGENSEISKHQEKQIEDHLRRASQLLYALAGVVFVGGLYYDLFQTGQKVIAMFAIADEPQANSGLFILAFIIGILGFAASRLSTIIDQRRIEEVEKSQEWELDV